MLLETGSYEGPEHEANIKLFRDLAMICDPTIKPAGESHAWTAVGRYIHIKVTNCDECHTLVSDHQMGRHWQKENVHPRRSRATLTSDSEANRCVLFASGPFRS